MAQDKQKVANGFLRASMSPVSCLISTTGCRAHGNVSAIRVSPEMRDCCKATGGSSMALWSLDGRLSGRRVRCEVLPCVPACSSDSCKALVRLRPLSSSSLLP